MTEPTSNNRIEIESPDEPEIQTLPQDGNSVASQIDVSERTVEKKDDDTLKKMLRAIWNLPATIAIFLVRIYQWTLSPIIGRQCRFHPSCSNYYILAVRKYGFVSGTLRGFWRIVRCNPLCRGGEDFP